MAGFSADRIRRERAQPMDAIEVNHITKRFGDFTAVDNVSFRVGQGEIFGLLGPNGAGKSTLIRIMTTLIAPSSGSVSVNGFDVIQAPNEVRRQIGVIPQAHTSDTALSAEENMLIFARLYGVPGDRRRRVIADLLDAVQLSEWADKPVRTFSGGMRRRLEIARGLVHEPKIFFLDEPTTGLDPVSRVAVWAMLDRLKRERDLTVLVTTHYMDEADKLCNRVAIVDHGRLVALDSPMKLKASVSGSSALEASFANAPQGWERVLSGLPDALSVTASGNVFRVATANGPVTTAALLDAARENRVEIASLSVQSTTLDDVFVHYTGRQLRDTVKDNATYDVSHIYGQR